MDISASLSASEQMSREDRKKYIRLIFNRSFKYLGVTLVVTLLLGTLLGGGVYMMYSASAVGFVMLCWGWFTYLKMSGSLAALSLGKKLRAKVPYSLRRFKERRPHRPAFRMDSDDFDDDLTAATAISQDIFTEKQLDAAFAISRAVCGVMLVIFSFFI